MHRAFGRMACGVMMTVMAMVTAMMAHAEQKQGSQVLDAFADLVPWRVIASNQVTGSLRLDRPTGGLCLDYDFNGVSGYVGMQRDLALEYPDNYEFTFTVRGTAPGNDLQFKLIDESGDNVWWVNRPRFDFSPTGTSLRYRRRHIEKAWGPDPDPVLRRSARLEFTIYNQVGGSGSVCIDTLRFRPLPTQDDTPLTATLSARDATPLNAPAAAVNGDTNTVWQAAFDEMPAEALIVDLGRIREFGGLTLHWNADRPASRYRVQLSDDRLEWREVYRMTDGGGVDLIPLPESDARFIRIIPESGPRDRFALREVRVEPLAFSASPNAFVKAMASHLPRGWVPRGFHEQTYWTILGVDGGLQQGLIGEDGAVEVGKGEFSLEPFVRIDGQWLTWADVETRQTLEKDYLPLPEVQWRHPRFELSVTAFAEGSAERAQILARYRLHNPTPQPLIAELGLGVRPFQVNPPTQFLNTVGGVSRIDRLEWRDDRIWVNGKPRLQLAQSPVEFTLLSSGIVDEPHAEFPLRIVESAALVEGMVLDRNGLTSGMLRYPVRLLPGENTVIDVRIPLDADGTGAAGTWDFAALRQAAVDDWQSRLDRVRLQLPVEGAFLDNAVRTATAHILISRVGPRLQPGTRAYSRSWIRDGAMISDALLRMGRTDEVRDYLRWYAPYQFRDGMVPCCVDSRGSDPVPENDSHGELIYAIAEYYRYTGDHVFLREMWPHVRAAVTYMDRLRASERTRENFRRNPGFYGLMPASISHEGYAAKPMHSYWDDFWALRGYKDAADIAAWLNEPSALRAIVASRDQFRADLYRSLHRTLAAQRIAYLPGSVELGDFDPTSTTIALAPGGEYDHLPQAALHVTFERYWQEFVARRDGRRSWRDYTPYEWRNVSAFIRLGWRERAWQATRYFADARIPQAWNQWAEVVTPTPRTPFFLGDLPHAWVASDFVRAALDMFAYPREIDQSLILAAGVPSHWFATEEGVAIEGLHTVHGRLSYRMRREGHTLKMQIAGDLRLPSGGLVLPNPYPNLPVQTRIDGQPVSWSGNELRILRVPADIQMEFE